MTNITNEMLMQALQKITTGLDDMHQRFDKVENAIQEMQTDLKGDISEVKAEMESTKNRLYRLDEKVSDFIEVTEHTAKMQDATTKEIRTIQVYQKAKIADLEEDMHLLKNKQ